MEMTLHFLVSMNISCLTQSINRPVVNRTTPPELKPRSLQRIKVVSLCEKNLRRQTDARVSRGESSRLPRLCLNLLMAKVDFCRIPRPVGISAPD